MSALKTWGLHDKGLCPAREVQSAAVSGDQLLSKAPKRLFHPCFGSLSERERDAQQDPPFSRVLGVLRKGLCTIEAVMAEAVEGWCCYPLASQGPPLCDEGPGWRGVDTRDAPPSAEAAAALCF